MCSTADYCIRCGVLSVVSKSLRISARYWAEVQNTLTLFVSSSAHTEVGGSFYR